MIELLTKFWEKVDRDHKWDRVYGSQAKPGCWNWDWLSTDNKGYGYIYADRKRWLAHRLSWEIHNGPIPKGELIRHICDNSACVNPDHLILGTHKDNTQDMIERSNAPQYMLSRLNRRLDGR